MDLIASHYPEPYEVFRFRPGIVRDVDSRRAVPRTDLLLDDPRLVAAERRLGGARVKAAVGRAQQRAREGQIEPAEVADAAVAELPASAASLRPVINATGVIVHTNLGRAPLSAAAVQAIAAAAGNCDVEFDLESGARARRGAGALGALASAAPALVLAATALTGPERAEIVVSRGELIEIGDRFRLPDLLASTGAALREVGTTNRPPAADYAEATGPRTAFILKVHPSNFRIEGFTSAVAVPELAELGTANGIPVFFGSGSGLLAPPPLLPGEPDAATALRDGAALVTASGDKILGGPQAGLLLGRADLVKGLARHPLARALRVDKLTLAALEATIDGPATPVSRALAADAAGLTDRAERFARAAAEAGADCQAVASAATVGGGGAPGVTLPSAALSLPEDLAPVLRAGPAVRRGEVTAVVGRVENGRLLLDLRAVLPEDDERLAAAVIAAAHRS